MTSLHPFAKLLIAADGEQVLFVVDVNAQGGERLQAVTPNLEGGLMVHNLSFETPGMAHRMLDACEQEQAEVMRRMALEGGGGGMAALFESVGYLQ